MLSQTDVVYPVKPGDDNDELRYSLRSLATNFPHGKVWIVGHKPAWVVGCEHIPGNTGGYHANVYNNIRAAVEHPDVSSHCTIFNDDFFVTAPVAELPVAYRGTIRDHMELPRVRRQRDWWFESLLTTATCLHAHGIPEPISYELHVPFVVNRQRMAETLAAFRYVTPDNPPQWRSLYGNMHSIGGEQIDDVKCYGASELHVPFHSTEDRYFPAFEQSLRELFPTPCRYEKH